MRVPFWMHSFSARGINVSYARHGSGPALVLVHGGFSDHNTNWEFVREPLARHFTIYAVARRGRGDTSATVGHSVEDEALDVVALLEAIGEPARLAGHSYGAHVALRAALLCPQRVSHLSLYEAPCPNLMSSTALATLEGLADEGHWSEFAYYFFRNVLTVPAAELDDLRSSPLWQPIVADAAASLQDLRALSRYTFDPETFRGLPVPVLLQTGSQSPRSFYVTDALLNVLSIVSLDEFPGQAHEAMTTAPDLYVESLLGVAACAFSSPTDR